MVYERVMAFEQLLDPVRHYSTMEIAWKLGLITGVVNHFTYQYPHQADLVTSFHAYGVANLFFFGAAYVLYRATTITSFLSAFAIFNAVYVSLSVVLKLVYNIYFRHRGIPTKLQMCATDWGLWAKYRDGTSMTTIAEMHNQLGLTSHISNPGDIIRIQPNHLSFCSIQAIEDIHGIKTKARKGAFYKDAATPANLPPGLFSIT
jgi:hypothetical protein